MESSLDWLSALGTNIKKIWDEIRSSVYGLPVIRSLIGSPSAGRQQTLFGAIENIDFDKTDLAKENTLVTGITNIRADIAALDAKLQEATDAEIDEIINSLT